MPRFLNLLACAAVCGVTASAAAQPHTNTVETITVNENWQLFLDGYVVARDTGFDRVLHHPRPMGIVLPADKPWETAQSMPNFFARRADGTLIAIYGVCWWNPDPESKTQRDRAQQYETASAYATSQDGIYWEKPNLGLMEAPAGIDWEKNPPLPSPKGFSKENNLGVPFNIRDLGQYGNIKDPARRYAISYKGRAWFTADIPDFVNDPNWTNKLTEAGGTFSPRGGALHFWDDLHQEWVAMVQNVVPHWIPAREMARFASKDLVHWTSDIGVAPDTEDPHTLECFDEPMEMTSFYSDGIAFGLMSWIHTDRTNPDGGPVMKKTPEYPYTWPWARKGLVEMRLISSRDGGRTWNCGCSRQAWIPHGTEEDSYDRLVLLATPPLRMGDEDWFYLGVFNGDHLTTRADAKQDSYYNDRVRKGNVALYIQKHNRYVSIRAPIIREIPSDPKMQPGSPAAVSSGTTAAAYVRPVLITKALLLDGKSLQLNVEANRGTVRVSIASAEPIETLKGTTLSTAPHLAELHPLPGFSFDDCSPIHANSIQQTVEFKNGATLESLRGRPVRLLFEMVDADLYGFRVQ